MRAGSCTWPWPARMTASAPVVSSVVFDASGSRFLSPVLTWNTNEPATTWIDWGTTASYGNASGSGSFDDLAQRVVRTAGGRSDVPLPDQDHRRARQHHAWARTRSTRRRSVARPPRLRPNVPSPLNPVDMSTAMIGVTLSCQPVTAPDGHAVQYRFYTTGGFTGGEAYVGYFGGPYDSGWLDAPSYTRAYPQGGADTGSPPFTWKVQARDKVDTALVSDWSATASSTSSAEAPSTS